MSLLNEISQTGLATDAIPKFQELVEYYEWYRDLLNKLKSAFIEEGWINKLFKMIVYTRITKDEYQKFLAEELTAEKIQALKAEYQLREESKSILSYKTVNNYLKSITPAKLIGLYQTNQIHTVIKELCESEKKSEITSLEKQFREKLNGKASNDLIGRALKVFPQEELEEYIEHGLTIKELPAFVKRVTFFENQAIVQKLKDNQVPNDEVKGLTEFILLEKERTKQFLDDKFTAKKLQKLRSTYEKKDMPSTTTTSSTSTTSTITTSNQPLSSTTTPEIDSNSISLEELKEKASKLFKRYEISDDLIARALKVFPHLEQFVDEDYLSPSNVLYFPTAVKFHEYKPKLCPKIVDAGMNDEAADYLLFKVVRTHTQDEFDLLQNEDFTFERLKQLAEECEKRLSESLEQDVSTTLEKYKLDHLIIARALEALPKEELEDIREMGLSDEEIKNFPKRVATFEVKKLLEANMQEEEAHELIEKLADTHTQEELNQILNEDFTQERIQHLEEEAEYRTKMLKID